MVRLISGVALAAAALAAILFLPVIALRVLAALVATLTAHEYLTIVHAARTLPRSLAVAAAGGGDMLVDAAARSVRRAVAAARRRGVAWPSTCCFADVTIDEAGARFFAPLYIGVPLGLLTAVHAQHGAFVTLLLIATVVVSDSAQYYSGRTFGRRPLAPTISPKKTIEGAIGGVVFGTLFMVVAGSWLLPGDRAGAARGARARDRGARHLRRSVRVASQAGRRREGQFGADSRVTAACSIASTRCCSRRRRYFLFLRTVA